MNPDKLTPEALDELEAWREEIETIYSVADLTGVFLMAIVGGTIARQKGYDVVGFLFVALISATGGGMIRDTLIKNSNVAAMDQPDYVLLATAGALIAWLTNLKGKTWDRLQGHADAIISGTWAVTGVSKGLAHGLSIPPAIFMGIITATGGSIIRDVMTGQRPKAFDGQQLMVIPALVASGVYVVFHNLGEPVSGMIFGALAGSGLALGSYWFGWSIKTSRDFAPVNDVAGHVDRFADQAGEKVLDQAARVEPDASRKLRHQVGAVRKSSDDENPPLQTDSVDEAQEKDIATQSSEMLDVEGDYRFENVLRQLHRDDSEQGRETERAFISEWLAWQEENRHVDDDAVNAGSTRLNKPGEQED